MDLDDLADSGTHEAKLEKKNYRIFYLQNSENIDTFRGTGPCTDQDEAVIINIEDNKRWCIERVPPHIRDVDEQAYTPKIVSIGPFHYKEPGLEAMQNVHKLRFLKRLEDKISENHGRSLNLKDVMKGMVISARACYSEKFDHIGPDDFAHMLVLDACFIVELFRLHEKGSQGKVVEEPIFGTRWMLPMIGRDLLLMENQIPKFILHEVFVKTSIDDNPTSLDELALQFFKSYLRPRPTQLPSPTEKNTITQINNNNNAADHLLALFQSCFAPTDPAGAESSPRYIANIAFGNCLLPCYNAGNDNSLLHKNSSSSNSSHNENVGNNLRLPQRGWVQNAKKLSWAGVAFSAQAGGSGLVVEFKGNELRIPALLLGDETYVHLLRNLIAYEQSSARVSPYVTCFAIFLGSLVDTPEDIKILLGKGIIKHAKGSNASVLNLVKSLSWYHRFDMKDCYMAKQIKLINKFSQSRRGKIRRGTIVALKLFVRFFRWLLVTCFLILLPVIILSGNKSL